MEEMDIKGEKIDKAIEKLLEEESKESGGSIDEELKKIEKEIKELEDQIEKIESSEKSSESPTDESEVNVKKAVKLENEGKVIGMIALWDDGKITACISHPEDKSVGGCYTFRDGGEKLFYMCQAWFAGISPKLQIKKVE